MHVNPYPVRVCPDGLNVAVRNRHQYFDLDTSDRNAMLWRCSDGFVYSDNQVADWPKMAPYPEIPATGEVADVVGQVIDGAALSKDIDPDQAEPIRDAIVQGLRLAGLVRETRSVGTLAADLYDAWKAVYPPRIDHDRDLGDVPAMLAEMSPTGLEILALSMSDLKSLAWETRSEKLQAEIRRKSGITGMRVTTNTAGQLDGDSVVIIDDVEAAIPARVEPTGVLAPPRIHAAARTLGYRPIQGMHVVSTVQDDGTGRGWIEYDVIRLEDSDDE